MTDLVERLKSNILFNWPHLANYGDDMIEAATEIERLQAENERLKEENPNFLREVSSEWDTTMNAASVTCHDRMVGGVLCRWWGDGETPEGVASIDMSAALLKRQELLEREVSNLTLANEEARKTIDRLNALLPHEACDPA